MNSKRTVRILDIIRGTTVDGPGFRTSIYFAGCRHRCEGCHNPQSWSFDGGKEMTIDEIMSVVEEEDFDVTLTGGDPMYNIDALCELSDAIHQAGHNVWLYTGYTWEEIVDNDNLREAAKHVDVIVDSPFILELKDPDLLFRGSSNQRIIDVKKSVADDTIHLWQRK